VRGFELVASVIAAFFVIGIGVGVLLVTALPAFRRRGDRQSIGWDSRHRGRVGRPPGYGDNDWPGWEEPAIPDDDDTKPRWPGGTSA
jgi:hypothetical protein